MNRGSVISFNRASFSLHLFPYSLTLSFSLPPPLSLSLSLLFLSLPPHPSLSLSLMVCFQLSLPPSNSFPQPDFCSSPHAFFHSRPRHHRSPRSRPSPPIFYSHCHTCLKCEACGCGCCREPQRRVGNSNWFA